jgi:DNA-binding NtrC family response regulator
VSLVLLVEDEPELRLSLGRYPQRNDYDLAEADTCVAAESIFRARRPDIVLTDYQLPDGNAQELLARLKAIDRTVPVVMLTEHASIDLAVRAIHEGAEQFLTKPVDYAALIAILNRLSDGRRAREAQLALLEREGRAGPDPFLGSSAAGRQARSAGSGPQRNALLG